MSRRDSEDSSGSSIDWSFITGAAGGIVGVGLVGLFLWYQIFVAFVDNYEYGFTYDKFTGKIEHIEHTGWVVRNPWHYSVHTVDIRPYQVSISANSRILNAKLVRFNPAGLETFVEWHGRAAGDETSGMLEILKCYAFDRDEGRDCPFLTVISVLAPNQGGGQASETKDGK